MGKKVSKIPIIPYKDIRFLAIKNFMGTQETIIYRLVLTNSGFGPIFAIFDFFGPQNTTKKLTHLVHLLGHLLSRNHVSNFSDLGPPPPPPLTYLRY